MRGATAPARFSLSPTFCPSRGNPFAGSENASSQRETSVRDAKGTELARLPANGTTRVGFNATESPPRFAMLPSIPVPSPGGAAKYTGVDMVWASTLTPYRGTDSSEPSAFTLAQPSRPSRRNKLRSPRRAFPREAHPDSEHRPYTYTGRTFLRRGKGGTPSRVFWYLVISILFDRLARCDR